jgi:hypothetical protein
MANGNTTLSRVGQQNLAGSSTALFLKQFAGEILQLFETASRFNGKFVERTIKNGQSAQFPTVGDASAKYHTQGENIADAGNSYLSQLNMNERVIQVDEAMVAATVVSRMDELENHYDIRRIVAEKLAYALAKKMDKNMALATCLAASQAAVSGGSGGTTLSHANFLTSAATLINGLVDAARALDGKDVPESDRYCFLAPTQYHMLYGLGQGVSAGTFGTTPGVVDRDFITKVNGGVDVGRVFQVAGINIVMTNNLPQGTAAIAAQTGANNLSGYAFDPTFGGTAANRLAGVVAHKSAIGTVKLLDVALETEYKIELQGTLLVAKYACGHGVLRPEAAVLLRTT